MTVCSNCAEPLQADARFCPICGTQVVEVGSTDDPLVGRTLSGKYRLLEAIGAGTMGTVYRGEHVSLHKTVALKILRPELQVSEETLRRFQREGIAAGKFTHPNAIQIFDFDRAEERLFYLAMEFVEGANLKEFCAREGPLPQDEAIALVRQILSALAEAHRHGIVHRDLKPENIMVFEGSDGSRNVKVLDFGLSKLVDFPMGASMATQPGRLIGTPLYMAPEQSLGDEVDHRSDLYAVGLILYELVSGSLPFEAESLTELITKQVTEPAPSLSESHPDVPICHGLDQVVARALEKLKEERYQSAMEMLQALEGVDLDDLRRSIAKARKKKPERARVAASADRPSPAPRSRTTLIGLAAVAVLAVGLAWVASDSSASPTPTVRVSAKPAEELTEDEQRYLRILEDARARIAAGEIDEAFVRVQDASDLDCRDAETFELRAMIYAERGETDAARADFKEALREDPGSAAAAAGLGWLELDATNYEQALGHFEEAERLDASSADARAGRGAIACALGERDQGRVLLEEAVELDPDGARAPLLLGSLALDAGNLETAIEMLVRAKLNAPRSSTACYELGRAYLQDGRAAEARDELTRAIQLDSDSEEPLIALASLELEAGNGADAIRLLDEPLQRHPDWVAALVLHGTALEAEGEDARAIASLERAAQADSGDPRVRLFLGLLHQRNGNPERALEHYDAAIAINRMESDAHLNRGLVLFELEDFERAANALEEAVALDPENAFAHRCLGIVYMDYVGGDDRAVAHLQDSLRLGGPDARVEGWIRRLGG